MPSRCCTFAFASSLFLSLASTSHADLPGNGSFEVPGFTSPDYRLLSDGDTSITGWTVHNDGIGEAPYWALIGGGDPGAPYIGSDGRYSVYLNAGSSIETTFAAVAGVTYNLSFWSKPDGSRDLSEYAPLSVDVAGSSTTFTAPNGTQNFAFTATLTDPNALLKFANSSAPGDYKIYVLDAASISAVPEPISCVTCGIAGACIAFANLRFRKSRNGRR
jgi:hypothetical protein